VLAEVQRLQALYPTYAVKTTGHSLGASLALLTQMSLIKDGFNVTMVNFGQPRSGDKTFAAFVTSTTHDSYRVTHYKD
jgi:predicted lipase